MDQEPTSVASLVISFLGLRKAVGIIGIALPFVLAFGKILLFGPGIESSISAYYRTGMQDVFVGSLCAIAVFLIAYKGPPGPDNIAGHFAGAFAIAVALFPVRPEPVATQQEVIVGRVHLIAAGLLFLTLAYFALFLFRRTDPNRTPTPKKLQRNLVYTISGYTILAAIAAIVIVKQLPADSPIQSLDPVFWLESLAVVAFGVSWLTKGEAILQDQE